MQTVQTSDGPQILSSAEVARASSFHLTWTTSKAQRHSQVATDACPTGSQHVGVELFCKHVGRHAWTELGRAYKTFVPAKVTCQRAWTLQTSWPTWS